MRGRIDARNAVVALSGASIAAELVRSLIELDEPADKQIEAPVIVIVEPKGAGSPSRRDDARLQRDVGKCAIAVVAIKDTAVVAGYEKVGIAVAVVVPDSDAHTVTCVAYSGFYGHVSEGSVAVVPIERVAQRCGRREKIAGAAVHQENVHPTVVVEIEKGTSSACGFRQVVGGGPPTRVCPGYARMRGRDWTKQGRGRRFR